VARYSRYARVDCHSPLAGRRVARNSRQSAANASNNARAAAIASGALFVSAAAALDPYETCPKR
jgi:hypothetical protein